jgi:hypothetical protein
VSPQIKTLLRFAFASLLMAFVVASSSRWGSRGVDVITGMAIIVVIATNEWYSGSGIRPLTPT